MAEKGPPWDGEWVRDAFEQYWGQLSLYAARIVGDQEQARDVVQETFLRLCRQDRAQLADHLPEWLYTVCRNQAIGILRQRERMGLAAPSRPDAQEGREPSPPDALASSESQSRVLGLLETLTASQQEVLHLRFDQDLTYQQISRVTGLSESNVGVLIHRGLNRLREQFGETPTD